MKKQKGDPMLALCIAGFSSTMVLIYCIAVVSAVAFTGRTETIAITDSGQVVLPAPLSQQNVADSRVLEFAEEGLRASFSHDFVNYRSTLNYAEKFYTTTGARMLQEQIAPLLGDLRRERAVMTNQTETPLMRRSGFMYHGRIAWEVEVPITIRFAGQRQNYQPRERIALMLIVQVPPEENVRGISVHTVQLKPRPSS